MHHPILPLETVVSFPPPGTALPSAIRFSPDGEWLTYLNSADGSNVQQLYRRHLDSGETKLLADAAATGVTEENISLEEALRRERARQRSVGITQYQFGKAGHILIPLPSGLFVLDKAGQPLRELVSAEAGAIQNGRFSPSGEWVAYVQNSELHIVPTTGGTPKQLTFGAAEQGKTNGLAEYIAQEEMGRSTGFWWSPDSKAIAFAEVDETHIPVYRIMHQGKDGLGDGAQEDHRYPFAGEANAQVRLGVVQIETLETTWMDLGAETDIYLARVKWADNGRLLAQRLNREQSQLNLLSLDGTTGNATTLLTETSDVWINLHQMLHVLKPSDALPDGGFIWASERTGFMHLYLYDWAGREIRPLTQGDWQVDSLCAVESKSGSVYFMATKESPLEKHLYATDFSGSEPKKLTKAAGMHNCIVNTKRQLFVDTFSSWERPYSVSLVTIATGQNQTIFSASEEGLDTLNLVTPQHVTLTAASGEPLHGVYYQPPAHFGDGPFPTIVSVYGGPHAQRVVNGWHVTVDMRAQYLAQHGFLVFKLDNRGSARRGLAFEGHLKHDMGNVEVVDQVAGVQQLINEGLADPERVGIYGWSYGGYMALLCLAKAGGVFKAAVSGAPVTHWDGYDTCYTERYMGLPQVNADGYERSSVMPHAAHITGDLMLIHGLIDENVHFRHTARLINTLNRERIGYDLRLFPDERHVPRGVKDRIYMEEQVRDFFLKTVKF